MNALTPHRSVPPVTPNCNCGGAPDGCGGVGQDTDIMVMTLIYEFITYTEPAPCSNTPGNEI